MLGSITLLLLFQLAGEALVQLFALPIPGPVVGMLLLLLALVIRGSAPQPLSDTANTLLQHLSLLFVPAGVGVMLHLARVADEWLAIGAALIGSTALTIAATALTMRALNRISGPASSKGNKP
jgi:holin-like protein